VARPPPVPSAPLPALVALLHTGVAEIGHEVNEPTDGGDPSNEGGAGGMGVAPEGGDPRNEGGAGGIGVASEGGDPSNEGGAGGIGVASEGGEPSNNCDAEAKGVAALMSCSLELLAEEGVG
jgi:hypothetical protein